MFTKKCDKYKIKYGIKDRGYGMNLVFGMKTYFNQTTRNNQGIEWIKVDKTGCPGYPRY